MADTQTPNVQLTNQTEGGNTNTWGALADANFEEIDDKFGDVTSISTTGGSTTLSAAQQHVNAVVVTGALVSNATINFAARGGTWIIRNDTTNSFSVTVKVTGQTGVTINQGGAAVVFYDGTDLDYANPEASAAAEVTIASAATCNILGAASEFVAVSGTTTVTSFGTGANRIRYVRAGNSFTITHNGTTLICPGGHNITTIAGDTFIVIGDASSNARIYSYQRSSVIPQYTPVGAVVDYAGASTPPGWLLCFGQSVSRTTYAALFAAIGTTHGVGNGTTTFTLPDYSGRVSAGTGGATAGRLTTAGSGINGDTLGAAGGAQTVTLTTSTIPANIPATAVTTTVTTAVGSAAAALGNILTDTGASNTGSGGSSYGSTSNLNLTITASSISSTTVSVNPSGGSAHANVQPTIVMAKIIFAGA